MNPREGLQLLVLAGPRKDSTAPLRGGTVRIGRDPDSQLMLDGDDFVSRNHAEIVLVGEKWRIRNLSSNGTRVNGDDITEAWLSAGDKIEIGSNHVIAVRPLSAGDGKRAAEVSQAPTRTRTQVRTESTAVSPAGTGTSKKLPAWLKLYLFLMVAVFLGFTAYSMFATPENNLSKAKDGERQYAVAQRLSETDTERVLRLMDLGSVFEATGQKRNAVEAYRELLAVRNPQQPLSPAYRFALDRIAGLSRVEE